MEQRARLNVCYWRQDTSCVLSKPKVIEETIINGMRDGSLIRPEAKRSLERYQLVQFLWSEKRK